MEEDGGFLYEKKSLFYYCLSLLTKIYDRL